MTSIIKKFTETKVYQKIKNENEIFFMVAGGSTHFGLEDQDSDIDIFILVKENDNTSNEYYYQHFFKDEEGTRITWKVQDYKDTFFKRYIFSFYSIFWKKEDPSIYIQNQEAFNLYHDFISKNTDSLSRYYMYNIQNWIKEMFKDMVIRKEIDEKNSSKHIYRFILLWKLYNDSLTSKDKDYLKIIKRIRYLSDEYKKTEEFKLIKKWAIKNVSECYSHYELIKKEEIEETIQKIESFIDTIKEVE